MLDNDMLHMYEEDDFLDVPDDDMEFIENS